METIIQIVKSNKLVYLIYKYSLSVIVNIIKFFVKSDGKLILFTSYGGRYFNDSPRCIYEEMLGDVRFNEYTLIWAFRNPNEYSVDKKVKIDTIAYFITALKARCWITNVNIERGIVFKGKNTYYFFTTHGTLPKLTGNDVVGKNLFGGDFKYQYDCSCAQSAIEKKYQMGMYGLKESQILMCGYPKNDRLSRCSEKDRLDIKKKFGFPIEKKIILYAPTFRDNIDSPLRCPLDIAKWRRQLGRDFILLFRGHPTVLNMMSIPSAQGFLYDVSGYPDNTDIMIISDYLVSDYSGIFFEYAVLHRPMYCFAYDYEAYQKERGLYFDIRQELPSGDEDYIIEHIEKNGHQDIRIVERFINKYVTEYGNATRKAVDNIINSIAE